LFDDFYCLGIRNRFSTTQKSPDLAGCKTTNDQTTCNLYWLRKSIEEAHTVKAEYQERDRATGAQLKDLARSLGKSVAAPGDTQISRSQ
jgi:hypothetical protein